MAFEITVIDEKGNELEEFGGLFFDKSQAKSFYDLQIRQADKDWVVKLLKDGKELESKKV